MGGLTSNSYLVFSILVHREAVADICEADCTRQTVAQWEVKAAACLVKSFRHFFSESWSMLEEFSAEGKLCLAILGVMSDSTNSGVFARVIRPDDGLPCGILEALR